MTTVTIETAASTSRPRRNGGAVTDWPVADTAVLDTTTLVAAYDAHRSAAYRLAYQVLGNGPAAEDAVQDAFLKLWTGAAQYDPSRGSMRGLLLTITRHTSIDGIRRGARRQRTEGTYCTDATYVTDGPEHATERADEDRHVRDALRTLPSEQRLAIEMAYFAGLTRRQIARETTVPIGTVKSRMRLGMRKLALRLGDRAMPLKFDGGPSGPAGAGPGSNRLRHLAQE